MNPTPKAILVGGLLGLLAATILIAQAAERPRSPSVQFNRDIRPLLSDNCFTCHGPDASKRQADLRLDLHEDLLGAKPGEGPVVPGKPEESELLKRLLAEDADERMPPPDSGRQLTKEQIERVRRWIAEGAFWQPHWSFVRPQRPPLPQVRDTAWPRNPIDHFILARLEAENLRPSPEADKTTLLRRVTFDLTGLPPTLAEIDAFLADASPDAYDKLVDRLLASPRYGEHRTRYWLDVARYGDTHGLHLDNERSMWLYRDWLIGAFNKNLPFDQFTIEQLAGDLLPEPTIEQRIASGFNRANVTTSEGGSIDEEVLVRYAVDRTEAMGTAWMGLTVGCAACHDHKFDPISQKEFYQLYAFFNSLADPAMDGNIALTPPVVQVPTPEQAKQKASLTGQIAELENRIKAELAKAHYQEPKTASEPGPVEPLEYVWIEDALPPGAQPAGDGSPAWQFVAAPEHPVFTGQKASKRTSQGRSQHFFTGAKPGLRVGEGDRLFTYVYLDPANPPKEIMLQWNDGSWEHRVFWGADLIDWGTSGTVSRLSMGPLPEAGKWVRLEATAAKVGLKPGATLNGWAFTQHDGTVYWDRAGIVTRTPQEGSFESQEAWERLVRTTKDSAVPKPVREAIQVEPDKRNDAQKKLIREYFLEHAYTKTRAVFDPLHEQLSPLKKKLEELDKAIPATLVSQDLAKPREAFVLKRGEYDKPAEKVTREVPAVLPPFPKDAPRNRLGLARWLVDPAHPLTARVTVNRFWQQYFGTGIVKTAEDFGVQGQAPSHPELLDWLATEFIQSGWNVKRLHRLIVTSATYRQSSRITPESYQRDPENRLLARGPRFRMDAEVIRDNALAVSGLLVQRIGGKSVKPYQPSGLWEAVGYTTSNTAKFVQDHGEALYRRSMYTFWKRTSPPPTMLLFDAPSRENCTMRRPRTNTPLAALALMNDVQFFEAARNLAQRVLLEAGPKSESRITLAFRLATARPPTADELNVLLAQYQKHLAEYQRDKEAATKLLSVGESRRNESLDPLELAAWTMVASTILNLDETITKP